MGDSTFNSCAYCWQPEDSWDAILSYKCGTCCKRVHYDCIKSPQPSGLLGDTFYSFKCQACSSTEGENFQRMAIPWVDVVMLTLYNLHRTGQGLKGFFHWKSHIASFIEAHWMAFFGPNRKRTSLWQGTVAGTLSSGCPKYFESGASQVDQGFWRLVTLEPPLPHIERKLHRSSKASLDTPVELQEGQLRSRRPKSSSLTAAMELKEKRATTQNAKKKRTKDLPQPIASTSATSQEVIKMPSKKLKKSKGSSSASDKVSELPSPLQSQDNSMSSVSSEHSSAVVQDPNEKYGLDMKGILTSIQMEDDSDLEIDIDIDPTALSSSDLLDLRPSSPDLSTMLDIATDVTVMAEPWSNIQEEVIVKAEPSSDCESEGQSERDIDDEREEEFVKESVVTNEAPSESESSSGGESGGEEEEDTERQSEVSAGSSQAEVKKEVQEGKKKKGRPRKRRRDDDTPPPSPPPRLQRISLFEEGELLLKLNKLAEREMLPTQLAQLRRKLICNQTNREYGLPVFDLEQAVTQGGQEVKELSNSSMSGLGFDMTRKSDLASKETRDLDRFMIKASSKGPAARQYNNFRQRLVGLEDWDLKPFVSPYTTRLLLPFIWRNYNPSVKPVKMRLLEEIVAYPHRQDLSWGPPPSASIDFCYVRPEHISSVNALCREFFWPGIDMSECLQYPDYSCVVMYKKIVIAFAFLVPDRGYNEAYISFVFVHPEWRGAGIATFMVYHLIQTCMGKDVVLHVSASNTAMFLYQRFGFKTQEFLLNFYHKYFPLDCKDSTHAFLMRLSR